jgi:chemotaxis protein histidine kinase CheA
MKTETAGDHEIVVPRDSLRNAVAIQRGDTGLDTRAISRAEQALASRADEFDELMRTEVRKLEASYASLRETGSSKSALAALFRAAHDIRGQAPLFGYPLAGEVAAGLGQLVQSLTEGGRVPMHVVRRHLDALAAIVRENARGATSPIARDLVACLAKLRQDVLGDRAEN